MHALTDPFHAYLQQTTGLEPVELPRNGPALPGYLKQSYEPHLVRLAGKVWLVAFLREADPVPPLQLVKQLGQLAGLAKPDPAGVCLVAEHLAPYLRRRLMELGQPFVVPGRQLFWPAIGSAETTQRPKRSRPRSVQTLGPIAQQLLISLLLRHLLPPVTITSAAGALGRTAASVSQAVKELEATGLITSEMKGRERFIGLAEEPEVVWSRAGSYLRSPVRQRLRLPASELPAGVTLRAGESALAELTELADPAEPAYAVASGQWPKTNAPKNIPTPDTGTCIVELWRYSPDPMSERGCVDPLSLALSLGNAKDERIQLAVDHLMEQLAG